MGSGTVPAPLRDHLERSRALGDLGDRPIEWVVEHCREYVDALADTSGSVVDLGTGAGVPGLVVGHDRPDLEVTLVDRRRNRIDRVRRAVRAAGLSNVTARATSTEALADRVGRSFDAATARSFGAPDVVLTAGRSLVRPGGRLIVSEPPDGDRWSAVPALADLGATAVKVGRLVVVTFTD